MNMQRIAMLSLAVWLTACSSTAPPDWQLNARDSLERSLDAYLSGNSRVEAREFERAHAELARTGRPDLLARAELMRCASRVASLVLTPCEGFEALRADAAAPERAYADYLAGRLQAQDAALLPPQHRDIARGGGALPDVADPLARLVAAGVLLQAGRASPAVVGQAVETAAGQGWRRPLLAWLEVQASLFERAGETAEAARSRRRIQLVQGAP